MIDIILFYEIKFNISNLNNYNVIRRIKLSNYYFFEFYLFL